MKTLIFLAALLAVVSHLRATPPPDQSLAIKFEELFKNPNKKRFVSDFTCILQCISDFNQMGKFPDESEPRWVGLYYRKLDTKAQAGYLYRMLMEIDDVNWPDLNDLLGGIGASITHMRLVREVNRVLKICDIEPVDPNAPLLPKAYRMKVAERLRLALDGANLGTNIPEGSVQKPAPDAALTHDGASKPAPAAGYIWPLIGGMVLLAIGLVVFLAFRAGKGKGI